MNKRITGLLALFAITLLAAPVAAEERGEGPEHQGRKDRAKAWFTHNDSNGDGRICPNETDLPAAFFERADQDGDGCLSGQEAGVAARRAGNQGDPWQMLQRLDQNHDGKVCRDEIPDGPPGGMGPGGSQGRGPGANQGRGPGGQGANQGHGPGMEGRPGGPPNLHELLARLDKDHDGCLSKDELPKGNGQGDIWQRLAQLDQNHDGKVCRDEIPDGPPGGMGPGGSQGRGPGANQGHGPGMEGRPGGPPNLHDILERHDQDGDGCLSKDELPRGAPGGQNQGNIWSQLRQLDANHDGKVCRDEVPANMDGERAERLARLFEHADADRDGCLTASELAHLRAPGQEGEMPKGDRAANFISRHDSDGDGKVSNEEFPGPAELFGRLDKDGDGILTAADFNT